MTLAILPRAFKVISKALENFEVSHLNALMSLTILFIFLKLFTSGLHITSQGFQKYFENSLDFEISHLGIKMTNFNTWVPLSFSHNFLWFFSNYLQWSSHDFKAILNLSKKLKLVTLKLALI